MTEKRFKVTDNTDNPFLCDWSVTDYVDGGIVHHPMTSENMANVMCDLLNELNDENKEVKQILLTVLNQLYNAESSLIYEYSTNIAEDEKQLEIEFKEKYGKYGWKE